MNILWLSHLVPYPPKGGVLQRSYNLVREICKYHNVSLLAFTQTDLLKTMFASAEDGLQEAASHLGEFCDYVEFIDIPCENSSQGRNLLALKSLFTRDPYTINWLKSPRMLSAIRNIKNKVQFDLVHFDTISLATYISEFPNLPKLLDHHNIESHMMLRRSEQDDDPLKRLYYRLEAKKLLCYEKSICPSFDLHITCSSLDSDRLTRIDPSLNIKEIPNGVDIEYFSPQWELETENHLVFAGGLGWYPNADAMLFFAREIWPLLKEEMPDIVMTVIGRDPPKELNDLAQTDKNLRVPGFVDDVRKYIAKASVYVCPIRDGGGTKLKLLDAFAMGMATVADPVACEGLEITDGKNVILAREPHEFAEQIMNLISNHDLRRELGQNARSLVVDKYAFTKIGKSLSDLYTQLKNNSF